MNRTEFVLRGGTLVDASTDGTPTDLLIRDGKIAAHLAPGTPVDASIPVTSAEGLHVFPWPD
jgi:dihydropyrimidinase